MNLFIKLQLNLYYKITQEIPTKRYEFVILFELTLAYDVLTLSYLSVLATVGFYSSILDNNIHNNIFVCLLMYRNSSGHDVLPNTYFICINKAFKSNCGHLKSKKRRNSVAAGNHEKVE